MEESIKNLIDACRIQAIELLKEFEEYYPFAFGINENGEVVSVSIWLENDFPDTLELINSLEKALIISSKKNNFIATAICVDVFIDHNLKKQNALEIRINNTVHNSNTLYYIPYEINHDSIKLMPEYVV